MTTRQCDQCDRPFYAKGLCKTCYGRALSLRHRGQRPARPRKSKLPAGWFGKAPKSEYVQLPGTDAGVPEIPYAAPIAPVLVRGMALTLHAHHADDLLDMVLPDGWRDVIEEGRHVEC